MMEDKRITYATIAGRKFPLCLTVAAHQKIIDTYGGLQQMAQAMSEGELGIPQTAKLAHILMEGGTARVKALAWMEGEEPPILHEVPPLETLQELLDMADIKQISNKLFEAIRVSRGVTVEVESKEDNNTKNADATQE